MYTLHFDGGKRKDHITYGCILSNSDNNEIIIKTGGKVFAPQLSSNVSEYVGLIMGMSLALEKGIKNIHVYGDSQLIINQMLDIYEVKSPHIKVYNLIAKGLVNLFDSIEFHWIPREDNDLADRETRNV